jgi:hypothetical protein
MTAEQILDMLTTQAFADLYEGDLDEYILFGARNCSQSSRESVIETIKQMMPQGPCDQLARAAMRKEIIQELRAELNGAVDDMFDKI